MQISLNLRFFCYFNLKSNYEVSKANSCCFLLNEKLNFNKNKTEFKMENHIHGFRETILLLQLIQELRIKIKTITIYYDQK